MLDHGLAWERWSTHVGIVLNAFMDPKTTARTVILRFMARKTVTDLLLKAAIQNSSSLTRTSSSVFRTRYISPKPVHYYAQVLRPIRLFVIGVSLLERRSRSQV